MKDAQDKESVSRARDMLNSILDAMSEMCSWMENGFLHLWRVICAGDKCLGVIGIC